MKKAIMYGAGNIGRGFIGQLFFLSGYETVFIDVNQAVVDGINAAGKYPLYLTQGDHYETFMVENVRAVDGRDADAVAAEIASADLMATAVGAKILPYIAAPIAKGIALRASQGGSPLNIIVCENLLNADSYLRSLLNDALDEAGKVYLQDAVGIAEASVGRMVPAAPAEILAKEPLAVCAEPFYELPVDRKGLRGELPELKYMVPFAPFDFYIRRKLYMHNMSHAVLAWLGYAKGYTYIWEAVRDADLREVVSDALAASGRALSREYDVPEEDLEAFAADLLSRFDNQLLGDTVARVGRDTIRKLAPGDRMAGTVELCLQQGCMSAALMRGIAAAFCFAPEGDAASAEVYKFVRENGVRAALEKYCGLNDFKIITEVEFYYNTLKK